MDSANQNLGHVVVGQSPDTVILTSDLTADSLLINSGDILRTNGYEVTVTTDVTVNGELDARPIYASNEGNESTITLGEDWTTAAGSMVAIAPAKSRPAREGRM